MDVTKGSKYEEELVSIIIPMYNAEKWLDECLSSVQATTYRPLQVVVFDDASTDNSLGICQQWQSKLKEQNIELLLTLSQRGQPGGVGYAKNQAVKASSGKYLCFLDSDDMMMPNRVSSQIEISRECPDAIVGSNFQRIPEGSTWHYTAWANSLTNTDLILQQYRECTIIMPTWFMRRSVFDKVGGFEESHEKPIPEDLIFFHKHLDEGGKLRKAFESLVIYRHHSGSISRNIHRRTLLETRLHALNRRVLKNWQKFTIWGCGRDGRNFYTTLPDETKWKVTAFCDIDERKIGTTYPCRATKRHIPIIHFSEASAPIICCVAMGRTNGEFEANVASLDLHETVNYWHFN